MKKTEYKNFDKPDEIRTFPHGRVEILKIGEGVVGKMVLEPGWKWSNDVKPIAGTDLCQAPHFQYQLSGRIHVRMESGEEFELGPGSISCLRAGHDAWVVGNEPVILVDWYGATHYAQKGYESEEKLSAAS